MVGHKLLRDNYMAKEADDARTTVLVTGRISEGLYEAIQTVERLYGTLEDELLEI